MHFGFRWTSAAIAMSFVACGATAAVAGDDGAAPIWVGIGSVFSSGVGWGKEDKAPPINYRQYGKIVVPPTMDLPPPGSRSAADPPDWPVNQEGLRKKAQKEAAKKTIAGVGDVRLRYTHPFDPNATVTVRAVDPEGHEIKCPDGGCGSSTGSSSFLSSLNPLSWVGMGKSSTPLGPEPDREWLTDPPKGFRAPVGPTTDQAAK
jgi:hypothetical protein